MKKLVLLCALAGLPLLAVAANEAPAAGAQGAPGTGTGTGTSSQRTMRRRNPPGD
jgi:hypothetical protein